MDVVASILIKSVIFAFSFLMPYAIPVSKSLFSIHSGVVAPKWEQMGSKNGNRWVPIPIALHLMFIGKVDHDCIGVA